MNIDNKWYFFAYKIISKHPAFTLTEFFYSEDSGKKYEKILNEELYKNIKKENNYYIHIPFCMTLCNYCYCFKIKNKDDDYHKKYLDYLDKELNILYKINNGEKLQYNSLNIWWWTPNILSDDNFEYLFKIIARYFDLQNENNMFNIDLNISFLNTKKLNIIKKYCNRVSLWVQTFNTKILKESDRHFDKNIFYELYFRFFKINNIKINVDVMVWLKNQTKEEISFTIKKLIYWKVDNISLNYFHKKDWLNYEFWDSQKALIKEIKAIWDKVIINYNLSQNKQIEVDSRINNIIWLWIWSIWNIFWKLSFYRYDFDKYFENIDKWIIPYDKYLDMNNHLESISYFLEKIFCHINIDEFIKIYWKENLINIEGKLKDLYKENQLINNWSEIFSLLKDIDIFPLLVNKLLWEYIETNFFWNFDKIYYTDDYIDNYKLFFDDNWKYIDQVE